MSLISATAGRIVSFLDGLSRSVSGGYGLPVTQVGNPDTSTQRDLYAMLRSLYYANDVYATLARDWHTNDDAFASIKELRMLQHAVVEAFVALVMPGNLANALPLEFPEPTSTQLTLEALLSERNSDVLQRLAQATSPEEMRSILRAEQSRLDTSNRQEAVIAAIQQVWTWSNWAQKKQVFIRQQAMLGNAYIYVASRPGPDGQRADRVYYHLPEPEHVTDIDTDERGFLTYYRSDVPVRDRDDPDNPYVVVDEWWKSKDLYRRWIIPIEQYNPTNKLPTPESDESMKGSYGIDFVPVVHAKAIDTGDTYGMAWIIPALEKQHELNRKETAFSQQLYRHGKAAYQMVGRGGQTNGVFAPPPPIPTNSKGELEWAGEMVLTPPPGWEFDSLVPNLPFAAHMQGINDDIDHLTQTDLPILNWYRLAQSGNDTSGEALQTLLKPAVAQVEEARGNAETALARADAMALTIGQFAELKGFDAATIGTYEAGDFEHTFAARDVIPAGGDEQAELDMARVNRVKTWVDMGWSREAAMLREGFDQADIDAMNKAESAALAVGIER